VVPLAWIRYGSIVISANNHRAGLDHPGDAIDHPDGMGWLELEPRGYRE
jgi:hypothetical protein